MINRTSRLRVLIASMVLATVAALAAVLLLNGPNASAAPHGSRTIAGSVPKVVREDHVRSLGRAQPSKPIQIAVALRVRDQKGLDKFLASASDPASPSYGHYMTQAQANAAFNPTVADEGRVIGWLRSHGLKVTHTYPNHLLVDAQGTVAQMNDTLGVNINNYQMKVRGKQVNFYANANNPTVAPSVGDTVQAVLGLNNYPQLHADTNGIAHGSAPYHPQDFADAYLVNPLWNNGYTGSGQSIGITMWTQPPSDTALNQFKSDTGADVATTENGRLKEIPVDGGSPQYDGLGEAAMDVEYSSGLAPGATVNYYEAPSPPPSLVDPNPVPTLATMTDALNMAGTATDANGDPLNRQITNSWTDPEGSEGNKNDIPAMDHVLASNSVTGHTYFFGSGDNGSWSNPGDPSSCDPHDPWPDYPASSAYVTSVGGTRFNAAVSGAYPGENAWTYKPASDKNSCAGDSTPHGSGGGYSQIFSRPSWQTAAGLADNGMRGYPDVSADADPDTGAYVVRDVVDPMSGERSPYPTEGPGGGTSLGGPLWAGMAAVMNQYLHANGEPYAGFMTPTLYDIANHAQTYPPYHDITSGTNGSYDARSGWDAVTGWGSPNLYNLARDWPQGGGGTQGGGSTNGKIGKIVYDSDRDGDNSQIYTMNADGSDQTDISNNPAYDSEPSFSPDGSKIVFESSRDGVDGGYPDIYTMNADGTDQTRLTNSSAYDTEPSFSPDGSKIAFVSDRDHYRHIYTMNADGSDVTRLTYNSAGENDEDPSFSPDGSKIVYDSSHDGNYDIYTMNADGTDQTRLTNVSASENDFEPFFSPDGKKIVYDSFHSDNSQIYTMNADGSDQTDISNNSWQNEAPSFSPDGKKIAFMVSRRDGNTNFQIYTMNSDGTDQTDISNNPSAYDMYPSWGPLTGVTPPNHPPVAQNDYYTTYEGQKFVVDAPGVLQNDTDEDGDALTAQKVSDPSHGTLTLNKDGSFTYTPEQGFNGTDSFSYTVSDGSGGTDTATVSIAVNAVKGTMSYVSADPTTLTFGQSTTLSGKLTDEDTNAISGEQVTLQQEPAGASSFTDVPNGTLATAPDGSFSLSGVKPDKNTAYRASFAGDPAKGLEASASPAEQVNVKVAVSENLSATSVKLGKTEIISGAVGPSHTGSVKLTIKRGSAVIARKSAPLNDRSHYRLSYKPPSTGRYSVVASFASDSDHLGNNSPSRSFRVVRR